MSDAIGWAGALAAAAPVVALLLAALVAAAAAALVHALVLTALKRAARRSGDPAMEIILGNVARPSRWALVIVAIGLAQRAAPPDPRILELWRQAVGLALPAFVGWIAIEVVRSVEKIVQARADISTADNLQARRKRTRTAILTRIAVVLLVFVTVCMMLFSIPGVRSVGVTLMASAGLAGLAIAAAAQPALKNLIAGVQMAFTEPIRIDDVVIVGGEWGRVEDIRLTYVVVKVWDERRLIVPISKFLEDTFQNWTRESAQLLGSVFLYVDPTADVGHIRDRLGEIVQAHPLWDGRFFNLQVTDLKPEVMELRALVTAQDASKAFDLRCDLREKLMAFVARDAPTDLARRRVENPFNPVASLSPREVDRTAGRA